MPYALREKVSAELNRSVRDGILSPIHILVWATLVGSVAKKNSEIRLSGDFELTVQSAAHLEHYPLPKIDDVFAKLCVGKLFSTLDLCAAYNRLPLNVGARNVAVLNMPRGLYPGIASAPARFQRCTESLLHGLPWVKVYMDDIIVAEKANDVSMPRQVF